MFKTSPYSELSQTLFHPFPRAVPEGPERAGFYPRFHRVLPENLHQDGDGPDHRDEEEQQEDESPEDHDLLGDLFPSFPQRLEKRSDSMPEILLHGHFHRVGSQNDERRIRRDPIPHLSEKRGV